MGVAWMMTRQRKGSRPRSASVHLLPNLRTSIASPSRLGQRHRRGKKHLEPGQQLHVIQAQNCSWKRGQNIFMWGHPKLGNGDHVRVEGVFETIHHQDRSIFYNQVEATKVIPLPR